MKIFTTSKVATSLVACSMLVLGACTTYGTSTADSSYKLTKSDIHFPKRLISDLDQTLITTFRADIVAEGNCLYAVNVKGKSPSKKYVLTWPKTAAMEYMGKDLTVVSVAADKGDRNRSTARIGDRVEFTGVLKDVPFKHRKGYHAATELRNCKGTGIVRAAAGRLFAAPSSHLKFTHLNYK